MWTLAPCAGSAATQRLSSLPRRPKWRRHEHRQRVRPASELCSTASSSISTLATAPAGAAAAQSPAQLLTLPGLRASCPALASLDDKTLQHNVDALQELYLPHQVARLVRLRPQALALPLHDWCGFFQGYGLAAPDIWKVLRYNADVLATTSPYRAGLAILFLQQQLRWSDEEVRNRAIPCYPALLARDPAAMAAVIEQLQALEMSQEDAMRMVCEFPVLLTGELGDGYLALLRRMYETRRNKYTQGGSYAV